MRTPTGGDRSTQWVVQYRKAKAETIPGEDVPHEETMWTRHDVPEEVRLSGPAVREFLKAVRAGTFGLEWRAIRIETVQRVEDW